MALSSFFSPGGVRTKRVQQGEKRAKQNLRYKQAEHGVGAKGPGTLYSSSTPRYGKALVKLGPGMQPKKRKPLVRTTASHGQPGVPDFTPSTQKQRSKRFGNILLGKQKLPRYSNPRR